MPPSWYNKLCQDYDRVKLAGNTEDKLYNILLAIETNLINYIQPILKEENQSLQVYEKEEVKQI